MKTKIASLLVSVAAILNAFGCVLRIRDEKTRKKMLRVGWIILALLIPGYIYVFVRLLVKQ